MVFVRIFIREDIYEGINIHLVSSVDRYFRPKDHKMRHGEIRYKADEDGSELRHKNLNKIGKDLVATITPRIPEATNFR